MSQDSFNAGFHGYQTYCYRHGWHPFCCPITPFLRRLKRAGLPLRVKKCNVVLGPQAVRMRKNSYPERTSHVNSPGDYCITYNGALVQKAGLQYGCANGALSYDDYRYLEKLVPVSVPLTSTH